MELIICWDFIIIWWFVNPPIFFKICSWMNRILFWFVSLVLILNRHWIVQLVAVIIPELKPIEIIFRYWPIKSIRHTTSVEYPSWTKPFDTQPVLNIRAGPNHSTHNRCWISELDQTIRHTTSVEYPSWTKLWVPSLDRTITKAADLCDSILFDFRIWKTSYQCFIWIFQKNEFYNLVNDYNL